MHGAWTTFATEMRALYKISLSLSAIYMLLVTDVITVESKNVLMIIADDLRPQLGCYEGPDFPSPISPVMQTPNIDALAAKSALFLRPHVQFALCAPSRASFLTGRRPTTTKVYDLQTYWRESGGNFSTIPQYFRSQGYKTYGMGKIFHPGRASGYDDPLSWSEPYIHPPSFDNYWRPRLRNDSWLAVNDSFEATVSPLQDKEIANNVIEQLLDVGEDPFFMAVGFKLPHLPWIVPQSFYDMYPLDDVGLPSNAFTPFDLPGAHWSPSEELRSYHDIQALDDIWVGDINTTLPDPVTRNLRRAYYASVSFMDYQVGRVLQALEDEGLAENTIVAFFSDHGYQLGEHAMWNKRTNLELATQAPLLIHVPGVTDNGVKVRQLVEYVDIFPTLVNAAGLPSVPLCPEVPNDITVCVEGSDLLPLMSDPEAPWKERVFSNYLNTWNPPVMGYSMRTDKYRFTEWHEFDRETNTPDYNSNRGVELYDRDTDPQENMNLASFPEWSETVDELRELLRQGWRAALPN